MLVEEPGVVVSRMQFADYVVSWALQALSRSLQRVAAGRTPGVDEFRQAEQKALAETAEALLSLWQMMQWSVSRLVFKRAQADLKTIVELCRATAAPEREAAERLLDKADEKTAPALADLMALLGKQPMFRRQRESVRDAVNERLQAESERWRTYAVLRQIDEQELVEHGMVRAFRKARNLTERTNEIALERGRHPSAKRLLRSGRWVHHTVNHLELLRPALSEAGRTRRWHLTRLAAKLDEQWALERFVRVFQMMELKPKAALRIRKLIEQERRRLDKQRLKLSAGAFAGGPGAYRREVESAVADLGLETIALLPVESRSGNDRGAV